MEKKHYIAGKNEHSEKYGLNESILIEYFRWNIQNYIDAGKEFHNGHTWHFHSTIGISKFLKGLTRQSVRTAVNNLIKDGVIKKEHLNGRNNTMSYSFINEKEFLKLPKNYLEKLENHSVKINQPVGYKQPSTWLESTNQLVSTNQPIVIDSIIDNNIVSYVMLREKLFKNICKKLEKMNEQEFENSELFESSKYGDPEYYNEVDLRTVNEQEYVVELLTNRNKPAVKVDVKNEIDLFRDVTNNQDYVLLKDQHPHVNIPLELNKWNDYTISSIKTGNFKYTSPQGTFNSFVGWLNRIINYNGLDSRQKSGAPVDKSNRSKYRKLGQSASYYYNMLEGKEKETLKKAFAYLSSNINLSSEFTEFMIFYNLHQFKNEGMSEVEFYNLLIRAVKQHKQDHPDKENRVLIQRYDQLTKFLNEFRSTTHANQN